MSILKGILTAVALVSAPATARELEAAVPETAEDKMMAVLGEWRHCLTEVVERYATGDQPFDVIWDAATATCVAHKLKYGRHAAFSNALGGNPTTTDFAEGRLDAVAMEKVLRKRMAAVFLEARNSLDATQ